MGYRLWYPNPTILSNISCQHEMTWHDMTWHDGGYEILVGHSDFSMGVGVLFFHWYPFILSTFLVIIILELVEKYIFLRILKDEREKELKGKDESF